MHNEFMTKPKKKRPGRPVLPIAEKLGYRLNAYLTNGQGDWLEREARRTARTASTVVRQMLVEEISRRDKVAP